MRAIAGTVIQSMHIQRELLGQQVLDLVLQEQPQARADFAKLYHGEKRIDKARPLGEQCTSDSAELTLVWSRISTEEQHAVGR